MVSVCGVLKTHAFFALIGSMIRADEASEITGVSPSATTSIIASVFGVVVEPMIASTLFSLMSFLVLTTAALESLASSRTMYSIDWPATVLGRSAIVFFSGMPSEPAGPVVDRVTPILTWAGAASGRTAKRARASTRVAERSEVHEVVSGVVVVEVGAGRATAIRRTWPRKRARRARTAGAARR